MARSRLQMIPQREEIYFKKNNRYGNFDELGDKETRKQIAQANKQGLSPDYISRPLLSESQGYTINLNVTDDNFEAVAVPKEYGKTGKRSYFIDKSGVLRGADYKGKPATADDPIM
jgi:hypothetical protein